MFVRSKSTVTICVATFGRNHESLYVKKDEIIEVRNPRLFPRILLQHEKYPVLFEIFWQIGDIKPKGKPEHICCSDREWLSMSEFEQNYMAQEGWR